MEEEIPFDDPPEEPMEAAEQFWDEEKEPGCDAPEAPGGPEIAEDESGEQAAV